MIMKKLKVTTAIVAVTLSGTMALSDGYGPFPVTLKGYSGDKKIQFLIQDKLQDTYWSKV